MAAAQELPSSALPELPEAAMGSDSSPNQWSGDDQAEDDLFQRYLGPNSFVRKNIGVLAVAGCMASGLLAIRIGFQMGIKRSAMTQARLLGNPGAAEAIQDGMFTGTAEQVASRTAIASRALKYGSALAVTSFGCMLAGTAYALNISSLDDIRPAGERIMVNPRLAMQNSRLAQWVRSKREQIFPTSSAQDDPTGLRTMMEALRELEPEEQRDVNTWWSWLNMPTSWQLAEMAEAAQLENLEEEMAQLQQREALNGSSAAATGDANSRA